MSSTINEEQVATLRHLQEGARKNYWESARLLARGLAFYLAITAALVGYVLTQDLEPPLPRFIVGGAVGVTVLFIIALSSGIVGLLRQVQLMVKLTRQLDPELFDSFEMSTAVKSWKKVVLTISICTMLVTLIFLMGMVLIYILVL